MRTFFLASCFLSALVYGQPKVAPLKPKLVIVVTIDNFSPAYLSRYWSSFSEKGFKRLMNEGKYCSNAYHSHLTNSYSPGYATISSGSNPSRHGIVSDSWFAQYKNTLVNASRDDAYQEVEGSFQSGNFSPKNLMVTTLADELKMSNGGKSKSFAIAMENEAAIFMGGHSSNGSYWLDPRNGNFISSTYYMDSLPGPVRTFNKSRVGDIYVDRDWVTFYDMREYKASLADNSKYETGINNQITYPYSLSKLKESLGYNVLKYSPGGNSYTTNFAIATMMDEKLGLDEYTDYLSISYNTNRYIESFFGGQSIENQDMYLWLDAELSYLLKYVDDYLGKQNVVFVVTGPNGASRNPIYVNDFKCPSGYFKVKSATALLKSYLYIQFGPGEWISYYNDQQFYLNKKLIEEKKMNIYDVQYRASEWLTQMTGVSNVITSRDLRNNMFENSGLKIYQESYNTERSGDLFVVLQPGYYEQIGNNYTTNYENTVPLFWFGWKIAPGEIRKAIETSQIAPTLAQILSISAPPASDRRVIYELTDK